MFTIICQTRETYYTIIVIARDGAFDLNNAISRVKAKRIKIISGHTKNRNSYWDNVPNLRKNYFSGVPYLTNRCNYISICWKRLRQCSDLIRRLISSLPFKIKKFICEIIAVTIYWPLARLACFAEKVGVRYADIPLADFLFELYESVFFLLATH